MNTKTAEMKAYVKREALLELKRKLMPGALGHIAVATILLVFTPLLRDHLWPTIVTTSIIFVSSLIRIPLGRAEDSIVIAEGSDWRLWTVISLYATLSAWAALFTLRSSSTR